MRNIYILDAYTNDCKSSDGINFIHLLYVVHYLPCPVSEEPTHEYAVDIAHKIFFYLWQGEKGCLIIS